MATCAGQSQPSLVEDAEAAAEEALAPLKRVVCHDDPVTAMNFVVDVLVHVFRQPAQRAVELMYCVHYEGAAVIGHWPESVACKRIALAHSLARARGFPLTFTLEEAE